MKITKTKLMQVIREELAKLAEADWDHPPEPAGSLGGYGDTDLYGVDDEPDEGEGRSNAYSAGYEEGYQGAELYWAAPARQKDLEYIDGWIEGKRQLDIETGAFKAQASTSVDHERDIE